VSGHEIEITMVTHVTQKYLDRFRSFVG
jgi:hypothetical protein